MFCHKCGNELRENAKFCDKCGTDLTSKGNGKNKVLLIILITLLAIIVVILGILLFKSFNTETTPVVKDTSVTTEKKTTTSTTTTTTKKPTTTVATTTEPKETLPSKETIYKSYMDRVNFHYDYYGEYTRVALYDIDKDGIEELFLSFGTCEADWYTTIYSYYDTYAHDVGGFAMSRMLFEAEDGNGIYTVRGKQGSESISRITKEGNETFEEEISTRQVPAGEEYYSNDHPIEWKTLCDYDSDNLEAVLE